jgi:mono/diheme cytochrome c family protein
LFPLCLAIGLCSFATLHADAQPAEDRIDFNSQIRPILFSSCVACHGPDAEERKAGLRLDIAEGALEDLGGYSALTPGDPDASELFARIITSDPADLMPPPKHGGPLAPDQIDLIRRWIEQGGDYATHWSYVKPQRPEPPAASHPGWPANPVDSFILDRLQAEGLSPQPHAGRLALARRAALDLIGLPPSPEQADAFANDPAPDAQAFASYVDSLMASPAYGERWASVWLDLARYADTKGYAEDNTRTIWAYRDYVIKAINENHPFDRFTIEQIAGDLLPDPTQEQLVATAFHRNTLTNDEGGTDDEEFRNIAVADRVNTTLATWMGTTMACAQCHTHKYDPITHHEYFQIFDFFNQSADSDKRDDRPFIPVFTEGQEAERATLASELATLSQAIASSPPEWSPARPDAATAVQGSELAIDGAHLTAAGPLPDQDTYHITVTPGPGTLTSLQLEAIADDAGGPGRNGNFVLTDLAARLLPAEASAPLAQFVRISLQGKGRILSLAEVEVFSGTTNIAPSGTASQSSTAYEGPAELAIDANTDGDFDKGSTTHTEISDDPWWELDLGKPMPVESITLWNRTGSDILLDRLAGFELTLLDADRQPLAHFTPEQTPKPSLSIATDGARAIHFSSASASFEQDGFPAAAAIDADPATGWAVGGNIDKSSTLTLALAAPLELAPGDQIQLTLAHNSPHKAHLLRHFRLAASADPRPAQLAALSAQLDALAPATTVPIMQDLPPDQRRTTKIHLRGDFQDLGDEVSADVPAVFHPLPDDAPRDRLALARWLVDRENPLTARVIANRYWENLFGIGLVETSEEFGAQGTPPSHPELLDWLAVELMDSGWDTRHLVRLMVLSSAYQQSSHTPSDAREADPFNRLLSRGPRQRLSAEMVRDQALAASGLLSNNLYGPPVYPPAPKLGLKASFGQSTDWTDSTGDDRYRRAIYTFLRRLQPYPSMEAFDAPNREVCSVRRIPTNTPIQVFVTLNDPAFVEAAQALARRALDDAAGQAEAAILRAFRLALTRPPSDLESARLSQLYREALAAFEADPDSARQLATDPLGPLPDHLPPAQAAAMTTVANAILNLDELFQKR